MASQDAIARVVTRSLRRLTEDAQIVSEQLSIDAPSIPVHPRYGLDHLRAKQLEALADWLASVRDNLVGQSYEITAGAEEAMSKFGLTPEQVLPEGGKITKRDVDAYLDELANKTTPSDEDDTADIESEEDGESGGSDEESPDEDVPEGSGE